MLAVFSLFIWCVSKKALFWSASLATTKPFGAIWFELPCYRLSVMMSSRHWAVLLPGAAHMSNTEWCDLMSQRRGGNMLTISYLVAKPDRFASRINL